MGLFPVKLGTHYKIILIFKPDSPQSFANTLMVLKILLFAETALWIVMLNGTLANQEAS